ncbi:glycosyltransferase [Duganella phyllosphaerae]|uniref:Zeaxanthin glucosyltransferase n=1 Tax=Duganella phyllosphaerae TaxID=762836 RepID=A0A1E7WJ55_9BURK|nr:glycosyltransferase [Duganella phyllosphaerae]OEZ98736.1 zeaxanthin glucosyltransferase [Duganella phyllosphaerae]
MTAELRAPRHFGVVAPAFPSHFSALAALAGELVRRGHRVTFLHRPDAAAYLGSRSAHAANGGMAPSPGIGIGHGGGCIGGVIVPGIAFHALGADRFPSGSLEAALRRAANPGSPLGLRKVILDMAAATDMLCEELPNAIEALRIDALLGDQMEAAAGLVAEALQLPFISVACALPVNREAAVPLPVMPFGYDASERGLQMVAGSTGVYDWIMTPHRRAIERQARRLGLSARGAMHECLSPLAQISQTIAGFDFPRQHLPASFHHVGPLRSSDGAGTRATITPLPAFDPDRPLVFASLGTLQGQRFGAFQRIARACRALDVQLLAAHCGGLSEHQAKAIEHAGTPGATTVCAFAPQRAALVRANAVVTHAGLNTVMDAIATGTPMLALPIAFDQPGVAARVSHAGIGRKASARITGASALAAHLRALLNDPSYQRSLAPLSAELAQAGGTARAADIVEQALAQTPAGAAA